MCNPFEAGVSKLDFVDGRSLWLCKRDYSFQSWSYWNLWSSPLVFLSFPAISLQSCSLNGQKTLHLFGWISLSQAIVLHLTSQGNKWASDMVQKWEKTQMIAIHILGVNKNIDLTGSNLCPRYIPIKKYTPCAFQLVLFSAKTWHRSLTFLFAICCSKRSVVCVFKKMQRAACSTVREVLWHSPSLNLCINKIQQSILKPFSYFLS